MSHWESRPVPVATERRDERQDDNRNGHISETLNKKLTITTKIQLLTERF